MAESRVNQLIDSLIVEYLRKNRTGKSTSFDDIFLYVGRNFPVNTRQPEPGCVPPRFYFLVENRMKALKRKGAISYNRKLSCWCYNESVLEDSNGKALVSD